MAIVLTKQLRYLACISLVCKKRRDRYKDFLFYLFTINMDEEESYELFKIFNIKRRDYAFEERELKRYLQLTDEELIEELKKKKSQPPLKPTDYDLNDLISDIF